MDEKNLPEFIKSMSVLSLQKDDVIILKTDLILSMEAKTRLRKALKGILESFSIDNHVIVLDEGMDVGVLRPENKSEQI